MSSTTVEVRTPGRPAALSRRLPIGAEILPDRSVSFRVWAPRCRRVSVVLLSKAGSLERCLEQEPAETGYFAGIFPDIPVGTRYGFRLDDDTPVRPDPASRFQPDGPEGPSQVIDPGQFTWSDAPWTGLSSHGQVIYEMHVGTFTPQGTWAAAMDELPELARAGMTVLELMPVADFTGRFGWGYDGVCFFAPTRLYGTPDDFRRFVDRAHACGIGVILDVVYNHYGPVGNTLGHFSDSYVSDRHPNEWGAPPNFDGDGALPVREFVLANVRHWIDEYHLDGLRFDATQSIHDASDTHILTELVETARRSASPRTLLIVAENEPQDVRLLRPREVGGHAMDAAWNDDFHHSAMVRLTSHNEAYYSDYRGTVEELLATIKFGFLFQGQRSQWQKQPRGTPALDQPATAFITFLQNHDQIANSGLGHRIDQLTSPGRLRAMTTLWLLAPQTPMFFQGQEFAASAPFLYFADNSEEQADRVTNGRCDFLSQFPTLATPEARASLALPHAVSTFERCRLDFTERQKHAPIYQLHIDLLRLRREDPVFRRQYADRIEGAAVDRDCLLLRYFGDNGDDRLIFINFGNDLTLSPAPQPLLAPPARLVWELLWSSGSIEYGGGGTPLLETADGWFIPGECAVVLRSTEPLPSQTPHKQNGSA